MVSAQGALRIIVQNLSNQEASVLGRIQDTKEVQYDQHLRSPITYPMKPYTISSPPRALNLKP